MGRSQSYLLVTLGALLLASAVIAGQENRGTRENTDREQQGGASENRDSSQKSDSEADNEKQRE